MYSDAHVHLDSRIQKTWKNSPIPSLISCSTPEQCLQAKQWIQQTSVCAMSCGIHPWNVETVTWEEMLPWMEQAKIIGEIGMDNIWCDCDLQAQKELFIRQLDFACHHKKPVVLHTKGMEKEILECIRDYPNQYLVHWYSCNQFLEGYRDLNCSFTIGPFPSLDPAVHQVVEKISLDRLMIETDGLTAIEWAVGHTLEDSDYISSLHQIAREIAYIKKRPIEEVLKITRNNLLQWISL